MSEIEWTTPTGRLTLRGDGSVRASVRISTQAPRAAVSAVQAVAALHDSPFLHSAGFQHESESLSLVWQSDGQCVGLPSIVQKWRQSPSTSIPAALALAGIVCRAARDLERLGPQRFLLSPAQVFLLYDDAGHERWGIAPLPLEGATYADFASASPDLLAWSSGDQLLQNGAIDLAYLAGATLYYCLIGEIFPEDLSRSERIRRLLMYRGGNGGRARTVLSAALPKSLGGLAPRISDFIASLLVPAFGRMITPARAVLELELLESELTAPKLAAAWEGEGNLHFAVAILNSFKKWAPESAVPWRTLARLCAQTGDVAGAKEAACHFEPSPPEREANFVHQIRSLAGRGAEGRADLEKAVARLDNRNPPEALSDQEFLFLVYAKGRWLNQIDEALGFLNRDFPVSWHKIIHTLLDARFSAERARWGDVLRRCREGRAMVDKLPDRGSAAGRYATAYLELLDGIGHVRAVEAGMSEAYLEEAVVKLENTWIALREFEPDDMEACVPAWLLVVLQRIAGKPGKELLQISVEAFCHSTGIDLTRDAHQPAFVPWFSEERIFAM